MLLASSFAFSLEDLRIVNNLSGSIIKEALISFPNPILVFKRSFFWRWNIILPSSFFNRPFAEFNIISNKAGQRSSIVFLWTLHAYLYNSSI